MARITVVREIQATPETVFQTGGGHPPIFQKRSLTS